MEGGIMGKGRIQEIEYREVLDGIAKLKHLFSPVARRKKRDTVKV